jgi:hypothetical protein
MIFYSANSAPSAGEWRQAADYVRQQSDRTADAPAELIVFAPLWTDPIGRQYFGDQMSIEMAARMDAARYGRIWEISIGRARATETRGLAVESTSHFGPLQVRAFAQEPVLVVQDFTADWRQAEVGGQMQGRPNLGLQEVGFEPHRCIKVVPKPNQVASMRFGAATLGSHLVAYVGLADIFTRRDIREPGRFEILIDDKLVSTANVTVDNGWQRVEVPTTSGSASVEFRMTAVGKGARDRRICFAAEARQ